MKSKKEERGERENLLDVEGVVDQFKIFRQVKQEKKRVEEVKFISLDNDGVKEVSIPKNHPFIDLLLYAQARDKESPIEPLVWSIFQPLIEENQIPKDASKKLKELLGVINGVVQSIKVYEDQFDDIKSAFNGFVHNFKTSKKLRKEKKWGEIGVGKSRRKLNCGDTGGRIDIVEILGVFEERLFQKAGVD